ncbi:methyltransferase domain-containing protein [Streptosporangium saharense]|uniref:methyltransferase domain-containing protein n=1 Tax=Streptosporangium saharense TaxID=1706840 RepID=UPI00368A9ABD
MAEGLREVLLAHGVGPEWVKAFDAAPREAFLPEVMWPFDNGRDLVVSREREPEQWRRWADTDVAITTQWDDGRHTGTAPGEERTSSGSMPSLVFDMFADLSVEDGMRVLEVGTGTGWCAALLSARLGEDNVVSVELDEAVADRARQALHAAGWHPEIVVGDGLLGWPGRAPYDRVLVTAAVREVPRAWIEQTRPGGVIVMPWGTHHSHQDAIVRLVVGEDGTASGRFTRLAQFMHIRSHRLEVRLADYIPGNAWPDDTRASVTGLTASKIVDDPTVTFVLSLLLPGCVRVPGHNDDGTRAMWLYGLGDRSWAAVYFDEDAQVYQGGPRDLWGEVEAAHRWWTERGRPGHTEFGLTVTPDGHQKAWLGDPSEPVPRAASAVR